ncbi:MULTISPECIES: outer membrane lipoprotein-sorting protein [unclassified Undibacterium]|uniref:outer membrane lipoprotein-sorting protein n=1 Tax=unclassified Undibacterium TaxID=2630295 RepID=UPI002AC8F9BF|nr:MULTISPECIES: outer membrane lipoprotein-sorting protein [unclassified Undibacterium]MEB0138158.1 outer membrane lipoprotein-sorting protein [Undibacterium sp. CCC2.1]MEB0171087.1 outer membrane lipoprotein-sorting protein [Undibacterium sp. CCC1.1]MEB0175132.1 outer membrane lipoprotein-sorting protein [Undibacterium sp. CCC3.4]MEB0214284.1 outer membrane lipoprotein-sorting protein [Undibacterium sp. 5I2]WPX41864.1 outer membrane lipoprotein-sorting protein [Undibacterium sp. CCC3.4]
MKFLYIFSLSMLVCSSTQALEVGPMLAAADQVRLGSGNLQIDTHITTVQRDGSVEKERDYLVYSQQARQSLVLMQSPAEKGQKVLMSGDDFWMILPGSQRPMRITPMQKLLGDAAIGDIATTSWAGDYDGKLIGEEQCEAQRCWHLSLAANRTSLAYQHMELWLSKQHYLPLKADLYVQSEKLAKQARFIMDATQSSVAEMVLIDQLSSHKETRIRYLKRTAKSIPAAWLNPMFLAKNPSLE